MTSREKKSLNWKDYFMKENNINEINIKKRAKKGNFAGGAITFKMESLIQLNADCEVSFVTSQALSKYTKSSFTNTWVYTKVGAKIRKLR